MSKPMAPSSPMVIGWRERIALPDLDIPLVTAKIDTGARSSALHATRIRAFERDGRPWVGFHIPRGRGLPARDVETPLLDRRMVKNTSGIPEERMTIQTTLHLGTRHWRIDLTLTDRSNMRLPLILGRTAIRRHRLLVDAGRSWLAGPPIDTARTGPRPNL